MQSEESLRLYRKRLAQAEKRIGELDRLFIRIYEDNAAGRLDDERFAMMSKNYTEEQKDLKAEVKGLQQQIHEQEQQAENIEQFVQRVKRNSTLTELTPYALRELVKAVYVDAPDKSSGKRRQKVHIEYDLVGYIPVDELLSGTGMTEIMPVPRNLILLSYQQGAFAVLFLLCIAMQAFFSYNDRIKTILEDTTMKVSVIQMNMRSLESKANFDRAEALVRRAVGENGPDVVVLPETWNTGFMPAGDLAAACDENAKAVRARFSPLARELNVNIVAGSVSNLRNGKIYNTACVFDRAGACISEYDKTHPFTPMGEHEVYTPGDHLVTFTLDGVRCGLLICYEVRFPELWRTLALRGAQVMFLPAQWTAARQYHWETLTAARAIENQLFVVSCNACGERDGTLYGGFSRIIDPLGAVLAQGGGEEEIVTADLDLSSIAPLRARVPVFHDRRPALYRL